jgi:hypothetical protein
MAEPSWRSASAATVTRFKMVPALVNGYPTFRDQPKGPSFRSQMQLSGGTLTPAVFKMTYTELETGTRTSKSVTVPARASILYENVLEEVFGVPKGNASNGPLFVETDSNGIMFVAVRSNLTNGTLGDCFPVTEIRLPNGNVTGTNARTPIQIDGLEQSLDQSRGTRTNLILNELLGKPAKVVVRLYEPGNRDRPIAEGTFQLSGLQKLQLSTVFSALGLDQPGLAQKERTNVQCVVEAIEGDGLVAATVTTIDNHTGDTQNVPLGAEPGCTQYPNPTFGPF